MRELIPDSRLAPATQTRRRLLGGLGASVLTAAALPAIPASAATLRAPRYTPPPIGSKWTYTWSDGRTETFERAENGAWLTWDVVRYRREMDGVQPETRSYNILSGNWMVTMLDDGKPKAAADPDDRRYRWPIVQNSYWRSRYTYRDYLGERSFQAVADWRVDGFERKATVLGPAVAFRLQSQSAKRTQKLWFAWELGLCTHVETYMDGKLVREKTLTAFSPA